MPKKRSAPTVPKNPLEYTDPKFWHDFHNIRQDFEWYGTLNDHFQVFEKKIKPTDAILNIGCGTSQLEFQLSEKGFHNITNIDVDEDVLKKKRTQAAKLLDSQMVYDCCSADNLPYEDNRFDAVIDKGTMDALLPVESVPENCRVFVNKMLSEIFRVLKNQGHYILVTLAQKQILKELYDFTNNNPNLVVRVVPNEIKQDDKFVSTVVIDIVKFPRSFPSIPNWRLSVENRVVEKTRDEICGILDSFFQLSRFSNMCKKRLEHLVTITLSLNIPEYEDSDVKVTVADTEKHRNTIKTHHFIIVPPDSFDKIYNRSQSVFQSMPSLLKVDRVVILEFPFDDVDIARSFVNNFADHFSSSDCEGRPVIATLSPEENSTTIASGTGEICGGYFVVESICDDKTFRRLYFKSSSNIIQSECTIGKTDSGEVRFNHQELCCNYQSAMVSAFGFVPGGFAEVQSRGWNIAVLGVGGGSLISFLHATLPKATITAVEIEPELFNIAHEYFGMPNDDRVKCVTMDAMEWLKDVNSGVYDMLFIDISNPKEQIDEKHVLYGPPPAFVTEDSIKKMKGHLTSHGCLFMNIISSSKKYLNVIQREVAVLFKYILSATVPELAVNNNYILFATCEKPGKPSTENIPSTLLTYQSLSKTFTQVELGVYKEPKGESKK
ncbi:hypothetical protein FO519_002539 [Halicephalobus sp. NKZ332]|nr:hypothetical protein FO519_002539 [Halicephalobus sp. NKZ332]